MSELRKRAPCRLVPVTTPLVEVYADLFFSAIEPGYCNPFDHDVRYVEVARIGRQVVNRADAKRAEAFRRRTGGIGG